MATSAPGPFPSRLFYVTDRNSGLRFLVDTGAEVSFPLPVPTANISKRVLACKLSMALQ